ncbi:methyltransferase domain-containing protein [Candidatus Fermentibacteria bacterium]|nr:methyltransferase domain-containing protein [Candidatus Fermentibacteria bacterium]
MWFCYTPDGNPDLQPFREGQGVAVQKGNRCFEGFAEVYRSGGYARFSERVTRVLPGFLAEHGLSANSVLDLACGEGTFLRGIATENNWAVGVDLSRRMLSLAQNAEAQGNSSPLYAAADMVSPPFVPGSFDLVTCWFDSLNYVTSEEDLRSVFEEVNRLLIPGGAFVFDMNTVFALSVLWQREGVSIQRNDSEVLEIQMPSFDFDTVTAKLEILVMVREGNGWRRIDETHLERGYTPQEVIGLLKGAGFDVRGFWEDLEYLTPLHDESPRMWFLTIVPE